MVIDHFGTEPGSVVDPKRVHVALLKRTKRQPLRAEDPTEEPSRPVEELVGTPPSTCSSVPSLDLRQFLSWTNAEDQPPPGVKKDPNQLKDSLFELMIRYLEQITAV